MSSQAIKKAYEDPTIGLSGLQAFTRKFKKIRPEVKSDRVKDVVRRLDAYSLHKPSRKTRLHTRSYEVAGPHHMYSLDLLFLPKLKRYNRGVYVALIAVDVFSKMIYMTTMKDKTANETRRAFEIVLDQVSPFKPEVVLSDAGKEFAGSFAKLLKEREIQHLISRSAYKAAHAENAIRLVKRMLHRHMTASGERNWTKVLQQVLQNLNDSVKRTHGMRPTDVNIDNSDKVFDNLYSSQRKRVEQYKKDLEKKRNRPLPLGTKVRVSVIHGVFGKHYEKSFSDEIFEVERVKHTVPITYVLKDEEGSIIRGAFYKQELHPL